MNIAFLVLCGEEIHPFCPFSYRYLVSRAVFQCRLRHDFPTGYIADSENAVLERGVVVVQKEPVTCGIGVEFEAVFEGGVFGYAYELAAGYEAAEGVGADEPSIRNDRTVGVNIVIRCASCYKPLIW